MANIQSYLDKISGARFGKDVRSSIVNALEAVNKDANYAAEVAKDMEGLLSDVENAAVSANTAASNANEAAQAVLDKKYILTATTEMVRGGTARPTAEGNALLEKLTGDSLQVKSIDYWTLGDITTTATGQVLNKVGVDIPAGEYTLKFKHDTIFATVRFEFLDKAGNVYMTNNFNLSGSSSSEMRCDFEENIGYISVSVDAVAKLSDIHLLLDLGEPAPENEQTIHSVGDMGWFDGEWTANAYITVSGVVSTGTNYCCVSKNKIPCKAGDEIKLKHYGDLSSVQHSCSIGFYNADGTFISRAISGLTDTELTATAPADTAYFLFCLRNDANVALPDLKVKTCITINGKYAVIVNNVSEEGVCKHTYIPVNEPIRAVGDVKDELPVQNGVYRVIRKVGHYVFDGSADEGWADRTSNYTGATSGQCRFSCAVIPPYHSATITPAMSNIGIRYGNASASGVADYSEAGVMLFYKSTAGADSTSSTVYCTTESADITDLDSFLAWLSANPIVLDYELAEPYYEEIADQSIFYNIPSYDEVTNVSIEGLHDGVNPTFAMRFPRNEDGALVTTTFCNGKKNEIRMDELTAAMLALSQS